MMRFLFTFTGLAEVALVLWGVQRILGKRGQSQGFGAIPGLMSLPLVLQCLVELQWFAFPWIRFGQPWLLFLLPLAGIFLVHRSFALLAPGARGRGRLIVGATALLLFASILSVSEPEIGRALDRMSVIAVIDRSRSIELVPGAEDRIQAELKLAALSMHRDDKLATVSFGAKAALETPLHDKTTSGTAQKASIPRDATHIEEAIRRALSEVPQDSSARIVLITDGVETAGDAFSGASAAVAVGVPVDSVLLEQKHGANVRIVQLRAPQETTEKEPFDLRIVTESTIESDVELRIYRDHKPYRTVHTRIAAGEDVISLRQPTEESGLHRYDVEISASDESHDLHADDNRQTTFVKVRGDSTVLVLEGESGTGAPLASALQSGGFVVDRRSTAHAPSEISELAGYDLIVILETRATDLSATQLEAFASYTRDLGGGLLLIGSDKAFGPGGYARTPIEEISPVSFDIKKDKRRASLAEVIAIDYSGSMGAEVDGHTKLDLANEAAAKSVSLLGEGDRMGVAHVDTEVAWTIPLHPVDNVKLISQKIRGVGVGGGGIYTDIALDASYEALAKESVNLKHTLLFADGSDAERLTGCRAKVESAFRKGMTTSVVSLGRGSDTPELEQLAKAGGGRFYLIEDARKLPAVFTQETIMASRSAIVEKTFRVAPGQAHAATRGIDIGAAPPLLGYVVTPPKPRAEIALTGPEGDPILASWAAGLGHTAVFTSDFRDRWGATWLGWPGASKLFGQLAREIARGAMDTNVRVEAFAENGSLRVQVDAKNQNGGQNSFRKLAVRITGPDGFSKDVDLSPTASGRYSAIVPLGRGGAFVAAVRDEVSQKIVGTATAALSTGDEMRPTGSDRTLLGNIALVTHGKVRPTLAGLFDDRGARRFSYQPVAPTLFALSAILLALSVMAKRFGIPEPVTRKVNEIINLLRKQEFAPAPTAPAAVPEAIHAFAKAKARTKPAAALPNFKSRPDTTLQPHTAVTPSRNERQAPAHTPPQEQAPTQPTDAAPKVSTSPLTTAELLAKRRRERGK